jgi:hypothetical protein
VAEPFLGHPAIGLIYNEEHGIIHVRAETSPTGENRHPAAVLAEELFFVWRARTRGLNLLPCPGIRLLIARRCEPAVAEKPLLQVLAAVSEYLEQCVVSIRDHSAIPEPNTDHAGPEHAPESRLTGHHGRLGLLAVRDVALRAPGPDDPPVFNDADEIVEEVAFAALAVYLV